MGLICNGYRNGHSPFAHGRGATVSIVGGGQIATRNANLPGRWHNWNVHTTRDVALPNGNLHPQSWMLPRTGGGMSMRARGAGALSADLIPTRHMTVDFTGAGDLDATAALIVSMLCAMTGSGSMTATITGLLNASVDFEGQGDMAAAMHGLADMVVNLLGAGDLDATISAFGDMELDIVVTGTGLTTANVGQAVWAALAAANNDPGTMGEKLNDAGSAANPWTEALPGSYVPGSAGYILGNLLAALPPEVWAHLITASRNAEEIMRLVAAAVGGKSSGFVPGAPVQNIKYRDPDDTKDVIDATTDDAGNRTSINLDLS